MKTSVLTIALTLMLSVSLMASTDGTRISKAANVQIFRVNTESVDVYVAKPAGDLLKIRIYDASGTQLMSTRVKKQKTRYIRYHLNDLPDGNYRVSVEKENQVIASMTVSKK